MTPLQIRAARMTSADLLIAEKKFKEASAVLDRSLSHYPADVDILYRLGTVELALDNTAQARAKFARVLEIAPWHADARAALDKIAAAAAQVSGLGPLPLDLRVGLFGVGLVTAAAIFITFFVADTWGVDKEKFLVCGIPLPTPTAEATAPPADGSTDGAPAGGSGGSEATEAVDQSSGGDPPGDDTSAGDQSLGLGFLVRAGGGLQQPTASPTPTNQPDRTPTLSPTPDRTPIPTPSPTGPTDSTPHPTLGEACDDESSISATVTEARTRTPNGLPDSYILLLSLILILSAVILLHPYIKSVKLPGGSQVDFTNLFDKGTPQVSQ